MSSAASNPPPRAFSLELTKGCNLRCGYCYYAAREEAYDPATRMSEEVAEQSVDRLLAEGAADGPLHLHLFGGEPLLNFGLLRHVIEYAERRAGARGREFTFEVTTNGTRFTTDVIRFLNEHAVQVGVSFDGPPEVQDESRPALAGSSYAMAEAGIRDFLESRRGGPLASKTHVSVVVTRRELDLRRIVDHLEELGFEHIIVTPATDLTGSSHGLAERDLPAIRAAYDALADQYEARIRNGEHVSLTWFPRLFGRLVSGERKMQFCGGGRDYLGVAANGDVALCYRFYEEDDYAMGNVAEGIDRGVTERLIDDPLENRLACSTCWVRYFCGGGCHHENLVSTGKLGDPNPVTCEILRHGMGRTLEIWGRLVRDGRIEKRPAPGDARVDGSVTERNFTETDRPKVRASCHVRTLGDERVVYEPEAHEVAFLNETAAWIFERCDGSRTLVQLVEEMAATFEAPAEAIRSDLIATLREFSQKNFLE